MRCSRSVAEQGTSDANATTHRMAEAARISRASHTGGDQTSRLPLPWRTTLFLFLGVWVFSGLSPVATSFDSRWTVYVAMNLWEHGRTDIDRFVVALQDYDGADCVEEDAASRGHIRHGGPAPCNGHWYNSYPNAGPILASPIIVSEVAILRIARPLLSHIHSNEPEIAGVLNADYSAAHGLMEMEAASLLLAITAVLFFWTARRFLPTARAICLTLLFALATSAYSTAGRALWSQTFSLLLLTLIVYLLISAEQRPILAAWAGLPVALAYAVRPTGALIVIVFTLYVAVRFRPQLWRYLAAAAPVAVLFFWYNLATDHRLLTPYFSMHPGSGRSSYFPAFLAALTGILVSPGRGLFVYTPVFLFAVWAMLRNQWKTSIAPWLVGLACAHCLVVASYAGSWWGGACYGPRLLADVTPVFALFLIPFLSRWDLAKAPWRTAFVTLALLGFALHLRGGWSGAVYQWNTGTNRDNQRSWDWSDPPFLRRPLIGRATPRATSATTPPKAMPAPPAIPDSAAPPARSASAARIRSAIPPAAAPSPRARPPAM